MVGQDQILLQQLLHGPVEVAELADPVHVRPAVAGLRIDLCQHRTAEPVAPLAEIDQQQAAVSFGIELRGAGLAHIEHRREGGDDYRQRRGDRAFLAVLLPHGFHRQGVLAHGDGDAQLRADLHADAAHGVVETGVLAGVTGCGHPVGREHDPREIAGIARGQVGQGFADGHAAGSRRIQQGQRRALAHGHGFAGDAVEIGGGHGDIGHRHLPGADHLVARDQSAHAAVADGDEETLVADSRALQHPVSHLVQVDVRGIEERMARAQSLDHAVHLRRLAEQDVQRHVHRVVVEDLVMHLQQPLLGSLAEYRGRATLTTAKLEKILQPFVRDRQHIAFLALVAPDLARRHTGLVVGHLAQLQQRALAGIVDQLRQRVGQAAGADIVDGKDRVVLALGIAAIDDFLHAAFHLRVATLHRSEIQILGAAAAGHRGGRTAAEADQHGRAADHQDVCSGGDLQLVDLLGQDVADTAGEHDRLVIAAHFLALLRGYLLLEAAEIAADVRTAELIVEGSGAEGTVDHDLQCRGDAFRLAVVLFPGLGQLRQAQVGNREAAETGLGFGTAAGSALVADLAAGAGGRARERRDRRRVVVRLHLHQDIQARILAAIHGIVTTRHQAAAGEALDHRRVVVVGRENAVRMQAVGVLDHVEQRVVLVILVDGPLGVEDLVPAMLGIGLGEHHQFDIGGIALQLLVALDQVADLVIGEGQPELAVGLLQPLSTAFEQVHRGHRAGLVMREKRLAFFNGFKDLLDHPVVDSSFHALPGLIVRLLFEGNLVFHRPFDALDVLETADVSDIRGL